MSKSGIGRVARAALGIFLLLLGAAGCRNAAEPGADANVKPPVPVQTATVQDMTFSRSLSLQGTVLSELFALVPAETGGTIKDLLVAEGTVVTNGQPLCRLDEEQLRRAVETRRQDLAVAGSSLDVGRALVERSLADASLAEKDYNRFRELADDNAVSVRRFEETEAGWKGAVAAHKVTLAQVRLAEAHVKQAEAALAVSERDLRDATVCAPIGGVISRTYRERGEMVKRGDPVFRIDDPASVEISAFAPAGYYGQVLCDRTRMRVRANDVDLGEMTVRYRSPTVDDRLRTFEVKGRLASPPEGVVAGMSATVELVLESRTGRGIPAGAIVSRNGARVVFVVDGEAARSVPVETGLETAGFVEIRGDSPAAMDRVVTGGQPLLNDGDTVTVRER